MNELSQIGGIRCWLSCKKLAVISNRFLYRRQCLRIEESVSLYPSVVCYAHPASYSSDLANSLNLPKIRCIVSQRELFLIQRFTPCFCPYNNHPAIDATKGFTVKMFADHPIVYTSFFNEVRNPHLFPPRKSPVNAFFITNGEHLVLFGDFFQSHVERTRTRESEETDL